jgi:hypothetical protein
MGLDDRDYMRERYRKRQGADPGQVQWNDQKARREFARAGYEKAVPTREVPLGSASWIGKNAGFANGGAWFARKNRGHDYQRGRWRSRGKGRDPISRMLLGVSLTAILVCVGVGGRLWLASQMSAMLVGRFGGSFPASGSVVVPSDLDMKKVRSRLTLQGSRENSVVQLIDAATMRATMSVYVRAFERVSVAAPTGQYRVRFIHGAEWKDPETFFGRKTVQDEVLGILPFTPSLGHVLDLGLGPDSNLVVRRLPGKPEPLQ